MSSLTNACGDVWEVLSSVALFIGSLILSLALDIASGGAAAADATAAGAEPAEREVAPVSAACSMGLGHYGAPRPCVPRL